MDRDEKGGRAKKSLKGQNCLLFFLLLYLYILLFLQEIPGFNGCGRGENFFQISCQPFSTSLQSTPVYSQY